MERAEAHKEIVRILPDLRRWAFRYATKHYGVDELVTDTVIAFLEHPERYNPTKGPLLNYLFSTIRNRAFDVRKSRKAKYRRRFFRCLWYEAEKLSYSGVETERVHEDIEKLVPAQLERMSEKAAMTFRLFVDGKTYREIAEIMGISYANVRATIYRARLRLRAFLSA